jgi:FkbM family methyltransferase
MSQLPPQVDLRQILSQIENQFNHLGNAIAGIRSRVWRLELLQLLQAQGRTPQLEPRFGSQFGEDVALWDIFAGQPTGFFIEVGAFDGVSISVSYPFEAYGWTGLLIEPIPERYEQCRKNRPHSRVVNTAVSKRGAAPTATFEIVEGDAGWNMHSYLNTDALHMSRIAGQKRRQISVAVTTMDELLKDHRGAIDFAVIDVEGGELELLDGFDLLKHKPRVMLIEDNSGGQDPKLPNYINNFPYDFIGWIGVSRLYIHKNEPELRARAAPGR